MKKQTDVNAEKPKKKIVVKDILSLIVIILLVGYSTYMVGYKMKLDYDKEQARKNISKKFKFCLTEKMNGKEKNVCSLYFYDYDEKLINKYDCKNEDCDYVGSTLDETDSKVDIYKEGTKEVLQRFKASDNNYYAFIKDGSSKFLYNISEQTQMFLIQQLKFYKTDINPQYVFVKKDDYWGIYSLDYATWYVNPQQFKYLGLINTANENGVLDGMSLIAQDEDGTRIMQFDSNMKLDNVSVNYKYPIYTYNINKKFVAFDNSKSCGYSKETGEGEVDINIRTCLNIYPFESVDPIIDDATAIKVFNTHFVIRTLDSIKVYAMNDSIVTEKAALIGVFKPVPEDFNMKKVIVDEKDKSIKVSITGFKQDFKEFNDFQTVEDE